MIDIEVDRALAPQQPDHLDPELAADFVLAQQRTAEGDHRCVLVRQARHRTVDLFHDVDDVLLEALASTRRLVRRPLVLLVYLACRDQHGELELTSADGAGLAARISRAFARAV